jgi:hypothetical protein
MQWHPIFAHLLRPLVQDYFEVETGMPVGDAPREADIVLLRRTSDQPLPYRGMWRFLTTWNVQEFKGPTVDPRLRDLDLLVELGLGINRRLNEERTRQKQGLLPESEVSFWYLAKHLGQRFLAEAERKLGPLTAATEGVWRCSILQRVLYLVSIDQVAVDADSLPMHLLNRESKETGLAVGQIVVQQREFWDHYSSWLAFMYPTLWEEIQRMARANGIEPTLDLQPLVKLIGFEQVIDQIGLKRVVEQYGVKRVVDEIGLERVLAEVGSDPAMRQVLREWFLAGTTPEEQREIEAKWHEKKEQQGEENN